MRGRELCEHGFHPAWTGSVCRGRAAVIVALAEGRVHSVGILKQAYIPRQLHTPLAFSSVEDHDLVQQQAGARHRHVHQPVDTVLAVPTGNCHLQLVVRRNVEHAVHMPVRNIQQPRGLPQQVLRVHGTR